MASENVKVQKEICWECTGSGNGVGIIYCKVCKGTGWLPVEDQKTESSLEEDHSKEKEKETP